MIQTKKAKFKEALNEALKNIMISFNKQKLS